MRAAPSPLATLCLVVAACGGPAASPPAPPDATKVAARPPAPGDALPEPPRPSSARRPPGRPDVGAPSRRPEDTRHDVGHADRHEPTRLRLPPEPSHILPGPYACKIDVSYKLRDCTVELDFEGRTWLTVHEGNLLALKGLLFDEGSEVGFEGALTDEKPFGCPSCAEGCTHDLAAEAAECVAQAVVMRLHRAGKRWEGKLRYIAFAERFEGDHPDRRLAGFDRKIQEYQVVLVPRGIR
jgi:hypothetical protein